MKDQYHHGDLKQALIEKGLEYISENGIESLSLRRLATLCGVSNAAPYAHFKDKEELIQAIQSYVTDEFVQILTDCINKYQNTPELLSQLGCEYVLFFIKKPLYYSFLFSPSLTNMKIYTEKDKRGNVAPFELFKGTAYEVLSHFGIPESEAENKITAMWALVHGLAGICSLQSTNSSLRSEEKIKAIINSVKVV